MGAILPQCRSCHSGKFSATKLNHFKPSDLYQLARAEIDFHLQHGWQPVGSIRFPDTGPTEISCSRSCSDLEIYSKIGFVSGSFRGLSIVGRTVLNLKFTGIQSVDQACVVGLPEIWY